MKYKGRIILLILSIITAFYFWKFEDVHSTLFIVFSLIHGVISWILGEFYDKYNFLSFHDPLTGAYNRRYFDKIVKKKFHRIIKRNEQFGILVIDINQFKSINDTFGHNNGDFILKEVSNLVQNCLSKEDILVRWGGDEFLVLFQNRDKVYLEQLMRQINERVQHCLFKCEERKKIFPTLSMGVSIYPEDGNTFSELIAIADGRMYCDKRIEK